VRHPFYTPNFRQRGTQSRVFHDTMALCLSRQTTSRRTSSFLGVTTSALCRKADVFHLEGPRGSRRGLETTGNDSKVYCDRSIRLTRNSLMPRASKLGHSGKTLHRPALRPNWRKDASARFLVLFQYRATASPNGQSSLCTSHSTLPKHSDMFCFSYPVDSHKIPTKLPTIVT
jgi:hypothetical protein